MAHVDASTPLATGGPVHRADHTHPITPGKVAMWVFLATEVMFFTGLIGSYIVLRAGSSPRGYSNLYSPTTNIAEFEDARGVLIESLGASSREAVAEAVRQATGQTPEQVERIVAAVPHGVVGGLAPKAAESLIHRLESLGAKAEPEELVIHGWPKPYDQLTNPLSIDLTAANTFVLICSSVTMVLALSAIQENKKRKCSAYLLATVVIGSAFVGVQVYEYYQLMIGHHYPVGISATGHFRPSVSIFASCFFTMTGFHGAHVTAGVIAMIAVFFLSLTGKYDKTNYATIENVGLYWHFVDLVWIILFTIVYLI
jgi:heme/copper-type cytochrome/quinol oxidase subunit 3